MDLIFLLYAIHSDKLYLKQYRTILQNQTIIKYFFWRAAMIGILDERVLDVAAKGKGYLGISVHLMARLMIILKGVFFQVQYTARFKPSIGKGSRFSFNSVL